MPATYSASNEELRRKARKQVRSATRGQGAVDAARLAYAQQDKQDAISNANEHAANMQTLISQQLAGIRKGNMSGFGRRQAVERLKAKKISAAAAPMWAATQAREAYQDQARTHALALVESEAARGPAVQQRFRELRDNQQDNRQKLRTADTKANAVWEENFEANAYENRLGPGGDLEEIAPLGDAAWAAGAGDFDDLRMSGDRQEAFQKLHAGLVGNTDEEKAAGLRREFSRTPRGPARVIANLMDAETTTATGDTIAEAIGLKQEEMTPAMAAQIAEYMRREYIPDWTLDQRPESTQFAIRDPRREAVVKRLSTLNQSFGSQPEQTLRQGFGW